MKKFLVVVLLSVSCIFGMLAQEYAIQHVEKHMILPDGVAASVAFFKKWEDAGKYIKESQPKDKGAMYNVKAKIESEPGYFRKTYNEYENEWVQALCSIHKETGSKYSVAWVKYDDDTVTRCVFTYKGKKLIFDRMDFF